MSSTGRPSTGSSTCPSSNTEHEWRWCLQKPTAADPWTAVLPGRTQAGRSHLPGRGGRSCRGIGHGWGSAGLHRGEGLHRDDLVRIPLAPRDGGQDHVADDPAGPALAVPAPGEGQYQSISRVVGRLVARRAAPPPVLCVSVLGCRSRRTASGTSLSDTVRRDSIPLGSVSLSTRRGRIDLRTRCTEPGCWRSRVHAPYGSSSKTPERWPRVGPPATVAMCAAGRQPQCHTPFVPSNTCSLVTS